MTIKDLPKLEPIQAHFLNSKPLDNEFATAVQGTEYYKETRFTKPEYYRSVVNKLAHELKFNANSPFIIKASAVEEYGEEVVNNASRYFSNLRGRNNIHPVALQVAAISWFIVQMIDVEKTKELNSWELKIWSPPAKAQSVPPDPKK